MGRSGGPCRLLVGTSTIALVALLTGAPAAAQTAGTTTETTAPQGSAVPPARGNTNQDGEPAEGEPADDIVITGLRASVASAQAIKVNADQFVDSITAIDIGALPDRNVAEALQRISGIQIDRNRGEGSGIAIRGLTQVRTEVNGRDTFNAQGGRALGFEDVPSELLAGVDVYKNPSAELIEGAIGGLVNLRTRMPFDARGFTLAATVGANNFSLSDQTRFNGSILVSDRWETGIGEFGILLNASYFESNYRSDEIVIEPYSSTTNLPAGVAGPLFVPNGAGVGSFFGDRKRRGLYGAAQWRPVPELEFYVQAFNSNYYIEGSNLSAFVTRGTDPQGVTGLTPTGPFEFDDDGTFIRGGYDGIATAINNQFNYNLSDTTDIGGGANWRPNERLRVSLDVQYVKATATNENYSAFANRDAGSYYIDLSGSTPQITLGPDGASDASNYYLNAVMDHLEDSDAEQKAARLDLEFDFDESSVLRSFTAGARYTNRSAVTRSTPYNWTFLSAPWAGNTPLPLSDYTGPSPFNGGNFFGDRIQVQSLPTFNYRRLRDPAPLFAELYERAGPSCCGPTTRPLIQFTDQDINTQEEETIAGYAMLRFGDDAALSGNVGVRVVNTRNEAIGVTRLSYRETPTGPNIILDQPFSGRQNYTNWLPSLNLRWRLADDLQVRAAASKGLSRPPFFDLRAVFNLSENYVTDPLTGTVTLQDRTGTGGNPNLRPLTVNQADVAVEWFPTPQTLIYGTAFYKELTNFLTTDTYPLAIDVPGSGTQTFIVTAQVNGTRGTVKGFELGGNTFFDFLPGPLSGLGVQANLTYVDSDAPGATGELLDGRPAPTQLQGLSEWSYNLVALYEYQGIHGRVAYNWRDDYLLSIASNGTGNIPIYRRAYGQVDASLAFDLGPHATFVVDVVNLFNQRKEEYQFFADNPRKYQLDDRRVGVSFRIRY